MDGQSTASEERPLDEGAKSEEDSAKHNFDRADEKLQFDPTCTLGHPYLQTQWTAYQQAKRTHILKTVALALILIIVALASTRISIFWLYYIVPAVCVSYGIFSMRKWNRTNDELKSREKLLRAASWAIQTASASEVRYSVEQIGQNMMSVLSSSVPNVRVIVDGGTSVPKYCGSSPVRNWRVMSESDRIGLHSDYGSYCRGKVWHSVHQSFALLTDTGVVLWFL